MIRQRFARSTRRRGKALLLLAVLMPLLFLTVAFAVEFAYLVQVLTTLQAAADTAALAAAADLDDDPEQTTGAAIKYAQLNAPEFGDLLKPDDVTLGTWDFETHTFTAGAGDPNAVRVLLRCSEANGNPPPLFFARLLGRTNADVFAEAIAVKPADDAPSQLPTNIELIDGDARSTEGDGTKAHLVK
jgi:hypothetical protein